MTSGYQRSELRELASTAQTVSGSWRFRYLRPLSRRERFAHWYMGRVAGRYCPCEWPVKVRWLIRLCGRIDDAACNSDFRDFAAFHLDAHQKRAHS